MLRGHMGPVNGHATFSPDGTRLVTASDDRTLRLWDARSGDLIAVLRGHRDRVGPPIFTPDGSRLISRSDDGTVRVWDMKMAERNGVLRGHESFVYDVAFRPDGEEVASAAWDGTVRLWDPTSGRQTGLLETSPGPCPPGHSSIPPSCPPWPTAPTAADSPRPTGRLGVTLWKAASVEHEHTWPGSTGAWNVDGRVAFSPDGTLVAAASEAGPVRALGRGDRRTDCGAERPRRGFQRRCLRPRRRTLAIYGAGRDHPALGRGDHERRGRPPRAHRPRSTASPYSPDGSLIASGSDDATVRLWDSPVARSPLSTINVGSNVYGVAFSPDGTRLAAGCADTTIRLIDVATRQEVAELRGHTDYVHAVAWSPDGTRLVSGSGDLTVRVWDSLSIEARARASQGMATRGDAPIRPH